jgi:hypothetical protein
VSDEPASPPANRWVKAWPDALAFVAGLALAWFNDWQTKDLVWSLWLSSLLVGYAMILWDIFGMPISALKTAVGGAQPVDFPVAGTVLVFVGRLFLLAFFTVHFGMFHFVHATLLNVFFPVLPGRHGFLDMHIFLRVLADYWPFVLVAAVAERKAFRRAAEVAKSGGLMQPYKNVVRLHVLIFFFAFASFAKVGGFAVYAVVYAVYFFPWRLVFPSKTAVAAA